MPKRLWSVSCAEATPEKRIKKISTGKVLFFLLAGIAKEEGEKLFPQQSLDRLRFGLGNERRFAQTAFTFLGFGCEHMPVIRLLALDLPRSGNGESLFCS